MNTKHGSSWSRRLLVCGEIAAFALASALASAQTAAPRITAEVIHSEVATVKGSLHPLAQAQFEAGRLPGNTRLGSMSIVFNRSAAQQAGLEALLAAQQNPASPLYHQWLTPEQFGARFGMAQADLDAVESWLQQQGFSIDEVNRSRTAIRFSGTAAQVEQSFATEMHYYKIGGETHFAPSTELTLPAAIAPTVEGIRNLNSFRPRPHVVLRKNEGATPGFTSSVSENVFFAPGDIATVYGIKPLYSAGDTGSGQSITVVGQSAITVTDIEHFQSAAGLTVKDPAIVLMPGTGVSMHSMGDETESDLDLEWSGGIAPGASIYFVYTGSSSNYGTFDAIQYAVDEKIGNIISVSYGACEPELGGYSLETVFQQAAAQGQTIVSASGDQGATGCFVSPTTTNPPQATQKALAVDYPASSPWVTGMGGTEISQANAAYYTSGSAYWQTASGSDVLTSALQYIPEVVWNDDSSTYGLSASGGGASTLFAKPAWQTGVTGIPADGHRDVPDISLYSSPSYPGYLYCTSDTSAWGTTQRASCNSGFRDAASSALTVAGGTSFAAPVFAGMLAIINQKAGYVNGQGLINPTLYTLAANGATYSAAFHDITSGSNDCTAGSTYCSSTAGFAASTGYDQATGLGSVDLNALASAWPAYGGTLIATTTAITEAPATPKVNVAETFTITVTSNSGATIPSGTVTLIVDGGTPITGTALSAGGVAIYTGTFTSAGTHQIIAQYTGDATHAVSTGVLPVSVAGTGTSGGIALSASPTTLTVSQGSTGAELITITPSGGYTGTVLLTFDTSNNSALANLCYEFTTTLSNGDGSVAVTGAGAVATQLLFDTNAADCGAVARRPGGTPMHALRQRTTAANNGPIPAPAAFALAGLLLVGFLGRRARAFRALTALAGLAVLGLAISACGGSNSGSGSNPPTGTYTITVTGNDSTTSSITGTTTFTFTIK